MTVPPSAAPGDVFARERQDHIARLVEEHGRARVSDLARRSSASRRSRSARTCVVLEAEQRLVRTHGGAIAHRPQPSGARVRHPRAAPGRREVAASAPPRRRSSSDGESIVIDASTTALSIARHLKARARLEPADGHHERPADRVRARRPPGDHRPDARRTRPLGGPVGRRPARRWRCSAGSTSRRRSSARPGSRWSPAWPTRPRRRPRSSARWSPPRARSSPIVDHTKWERAAFATFCRDRRRSTWS